MSQTTQNGLTDLQAGKLIADVEHVREEVSEQGLVLKEILDKLDDRVPRLEFEQYRQQRAKETDERYILRSELNGLIPFWRVATHGLTKFLAVGATITVLLAATLVVIQSIPFTKPVLDKATKVTKEG